MAGKPPPCRGKGHRNCLIKEHPIKVPRAALAYVTVGSKLTVPAEAVVIITTGHVSETVGRNQIGKLRASVVHKPFGLRQLRESLMTLVETPGPG